MGQSGQGEGWGKTSGGAFLLKSWCDTNVVILLIIVIMIDTWFLPISKKIIWNY